MKWRYPALDNRGVDFLAYFIYAMTALLMFTEGWRWERRIFDLRDGVALSLADRHSPPLVPTPDRAEPDYRKLSAIAFVLSGAIMLWPMMWFAAGGRNAAPSVATVGEAVIGALAGAIIGILLFVAALVGWRRRFGTSPENGAGD